PRGIVQVNGCPGLTLLPAIVVVVPMHDEVAIFGSAFALQPLHLCELRVKVLQLSQRLDAGPGFSRSAADAILNQPDRHIDFFLESLRKEVGNRRESSALRYGLRRTYFPGALWNGCA